MKTVKQEPMLEVMPADYDPNKVEEVEYRPLLTNKRKRGDKDASATALKDSKKPRKAQELVKETNAGQKPTNSVEKLKEKETTPSEEILAGSHMCVLGCGEEVEDDDSDLATHYANHYLQEGVRASLFVHPVLGHLRHEDLELLEETYKSLLLGSSVKKYQCLHSKTCTSRKMMFREFAVHNLTEHWQLEKLLERDSRPGLDRVLERLYPSPQVKAREEARRKEKEAKKLVKVKLEVKDKQEVRANPPEIQRKAPEKPSKGPEMRTKDSMKVKVKREAVEAVDFELEEACNEEEVDNPSPEQRTGDRQQRNENQKVVQNPPPRGVALTKATPAPEQPRISKPPLVPAKEVPAKEVPAKEIPAKEVPAKEVPGRVEVVRKDTTARVENKEKLSRVEVVRKEVVRLPLKEVVRRVAVDRVHNCVLCNDKDGRSMNLGSGLWDIKYHYAVSNLNSDALINHSKTFAITVGILLVMVNVCIFDIIITGTVAIL